MSYTWLFWVGSSLPVTNAVLGTEPRPLHAKHALSLLSCHSGLYPKFLNLSLCTIGSWVYFMKPQSECESVVLWWDPQICISIRLLQSVLKPHLSSTVSGYFQNKQISLLWLFQLKWFIKFVPPLVGITVSWVSSPLMSAFSQGLIKDY